MGQCKLTIEIAHGLVQMEQGVSVIRAAQKIEVAHRAVCDLEKVAAKLPPSTTPKQKVSSGEKTT